MPIFVLEAEDIQEAEVEQAPCWFPTGTFDGPSGDCRIDASAILENIRLPPSGDGYRYRIAVYERTEEFMGNWAIVIRGVGSHHNKDYPKDANVMSAEFVKALREAGHTVVAASFTHGGEDDIAKQDEQPKP